MEKVRRAPARETATADAEHPNEPHHAHSALAETHHRPATPADIATLRPGVDVKQWLLTSGRTISSLVVGYIVVALVF